MHVARMVVGNEALAALGDPEHLAAKAPRSDQREAIFRERRFLEPEGATYIGRDDPEPMAGNSEDTLGIFFANEMRILQRCNEGKALLRRIPARQRRAGL